MSLSTAVSSPATGFRPWLDPHLTAGTWAVRHDWRAHLPSPPVVPVPSDLGNEASAVGRAVDARLRLAFTTEDAVAEATQTGIGICAAMAATCFAESRREWWRAIAAAGAAAAGAITRMSVQLHLDDRATPFWRGPGTEAALARLLLIAAWFEVMFRAGSAGFDGTPIARHATGSGGRTELLALVPQPLVDDVVRLTSAAANSPLADLRADSTRQMRVAGPGFVGSNAIRGADADLLVADTLVEFKCTKTPSELPLTTIWQLLGYVLMDYNDSRRIGQVALYHCRAAAMRQWPLDQYLQLLACDTDLATLRHEAWQLCHAAPAYYRPYQPEHVELLEQVLAQLDVPPPGACRGCRRPRPQDRSNPYARWYCSTECRQATQQIAAAALASIRLFLTTYASERRACPPAQAAQPDRR